MASLGLPDPYLTEYEASSTRPLASSTYRSAASRPIVTPRAVSTAANPEYVLPEVLVNPPAARGAETPSFFSYLRQLGSQYYSTSSGSPSPAEGPPGTAAWQPPDRATAGATLTVPPRVVPGINFYQQAPAARPGQLLVPDSNSTFPTDSFVPGSQALAQPRLLPSVSTARGWLGRGRFSSAAFTAEDMPGFNSLRRGIVLCVMLLLVNSLFACLGRADFNFVLYLLGYHLWCVESDTKTLTGLKRLIRGARQYAILLCVAAVVDTTWLFIAYSTWVCEKGDPELCFPEPENLKVRWAYSIHSWALGLSTLNLLLKLLVIFLSFAWVQQQRAALGLGGGSPMPGGTSILPPSLE